jgi:hypothetical protein
MKAKAKSEESAAPEPEKEVEKAAAPKPAATPAIPKPGADKAKIFGKPMQQKPFMPPKGGKGGGGAIRQMRSQRGR